MRPIYAVKFVGKALIKMFVAILIAILVVLSCSSRRGTAALGWRYDSGFRLALAQLRLEGGRLGGLGRSDRRGFTR